MFSRIAPRYDFGNHLLSMNVDRLWRRRAARIGVQSETRRVLDCCGGTGDMALACARRMNLYGKVIGCDFAEPMLRIAKAKFRSHLFKAGPRSPSCFVAAADSVALPFADNYFDLATVAFGLRNVADRDAALREMVRVVRPGGRVLVLEFTTPPNPIIRALYLFYFKRLLPAVARIGTGSKEYGYLPASVAEFPSPPQLTALMERAGLTQVRFELQTFGIAAIHWGQK